MEGLRDQPAIRAAFRSLVVLIIFVGAVLLIADPASARRRYTTDANMDDQGVDFSIQEVSTNSGQTTTTTGSGVSCAYELHGNSGLFNGFWNAPPSKTSVVARRTCTDGSDEFVWVDACAFLDLGRVCARGTPSSIDPIVLAREARDRLPVPGVAISTNPRRGLVGIKSWFWISRRGDGPLSESLSRFGVRVDVEARPVRYEWDFGDGTTKTTSSPGRPYPERSPVIHIYERSSARFPEGYRVSVTVVFDVRWRTNGGRWRALPGITRVSERSYRVAESQAVNVDD